MKKIIKFLLLQAFFLILFSCGNDFPAENAYAKPSGKENSSQNSGKTESTENGVQSGKDDGEEKTDGDESVDETEVLPEEEDEIFKRKWTVLVYMAADNNLEGDAIADFNELENADLGEDVTVLVLFDRAENYDATNGNWTDTRLYEIKKDRFLHKTLIASERLDCNELCLKANCPTELDMANPSTLEGFSAFARRVYPAENYALIIWGHGTGWRNQEDVLPSQNSFRACAIDCASDSYMTISQVRSALESGMNGKKFALIGFDTCFGLCLEAAYELSGCARFMLGTPALVPESGWNYTKVFNSFASSDLKVSSFVSAVSSQYRESYKNYAYASFACVNLEKIPALVEVFSDYSSGLASAISSKSVCDEVFSICTKNCVSYCATSYPTDFYLDVRDLLSCMNSSGIPEIQENPFASDLKDALDEAVVESWSASGSNASLGVFFCIYRDNGLIQPSHPSMYVNGSRDTLLSRFVSDCTGYVPSFSGGKSLLDKLFYTIF